MEQIPSVAESLLGIAGLDAINLANTYRVTGNGRTYKVEDKYSTSIPGWIWRVCPSGSRPFQYEGHDWSIRRDFTCCDSCCFPRQECLGYSFCRPRSRLQVENISYIVDQPCTCCYNTWRIHDTTTNPDIEVTGENSYWISTNMCFKDCFQATYLVQRNGRVLATIERPASFQNCLLTNLSVQNFNGSSHASQSDKYTIKIAETTPEKALKDQLTAITLVIDMRNYEHVRKSNTPMHQHMNRRTRH